MKFKTPAREQSRAYMNTCLVFSEFISRSLIERKFFQNENISQASLLYLANDLLRILRPDQNKKMNVVKELVISYKQVTGKPLSTEEQEYEANDREIDVVGEVLNGLRYSTLGLLGNSFVTSIYNTVSQRLWEHVPAIVGCAGAVLLGLEAVHGIVDKILASSQFNSSQQAIIRPWLQCVGRLALGFIPKVHATSEGVHYHYPSMQGHISTYGTREFVSKLGEDITYKRFGTLSTPEGNHPAEYVTQFKLHQVDHLKDEKIRIQVVNEAGEKVPVEFSVIQGIYGPQISVSSPDAMLASHWSRYFVTTQVNYLGAIFLAANTWRHNRIATTVGFLLINSFTSVMASTATRHFKKNCFMENCLELLDDGNFFLAKNACIEASQAGFDAAEVAYTFGKIAEKMGQNTHALQQFQTALSLNSSHHDAIVAYREADSVFEDFAKRVSLGFNLTDPPDLSELCDHVYLFRKQFFKAHDLYIPRPIEYMLTYISGIYLSSLQKAHPETLKVLEPHYARLKNYGWVNGEIFNRSTLEDERSTYSGTAFLKQGSKRIIITHRIGEELLCEIWHHGVKYVYDNDFYKEVNVARSFVEFVKKKYPGYYISHTGHLAGAAIAEAIACEFKSVAITVNSPGFIHSQDETFSCEAQIVTYVAYQNFANTLSRHIGSMRHVDPGSSYFHDIFSLYCIKFYRTLPNVEIIQSIYQQFFLRFLEVMNTVDPCIGYPSDSYHVRRWKNNPLQKAKKITAFERTFEFTPKDKTLLMSRNINIDTLSDDFQRIWHNGRIGIEHFSIRAKKFLKSYLDNGLYPENINPKILQLYYITHDNEVVVISDTHTEFVSYSVFDFQDYIEMKLYETTVSPFEWKKDNNYKRDLSRIARYCNQFEEQSDEEGVRGQVLK